MLERNRSGLNQDYWKHYFKFLNITRCQKGLQCLTLREETAGVPLPSNGKLSVQIKLSVGDGDERMPKPREIFYKSLFESKI